MREEIDILLLPNRALIFEKQMHFTKLSIHFVLFSDVHMKKNKSSWRHSSRDITKPTK